ncbi:STAS domain-containing protein [Marinobacterium sediminicola]|nr:STAS domain-containing protein [Marinobacterium sediminicola]ULG68667.1 STAS domain-containing protein [Marinobacterium sediminicola]
MTAAKVESQGNGVVRVSGDLTFATVLKLRPLLLEQLRSSGSQCTLDLSGVERVDSSALSLWLVCQRQALKQGQQLKLSAVPDDFAAIADLVGLDEELTRAA